MSREEFQKLLGGYATDTLSEAERHALFEAALEDQELFEALAKEQALRDVLQEPSARQQLLDALGPPRTPARIRAWRWLRQPAALAVAGGVAILLVVAGLALRRSRRPAYREVILADVPAPAAKEFAPPPPRPKPKLQAVLPRPPVLHPETQIADALLLPAAKPAPPPPRAVTVARLAQSSQQSADLARQLYTQPNTTALGFAAGALPQTHAKMARALAVVPAASNLGVRYSLLLKGADGEYAPARLDTEFRPGDTVRLRFEPNDSGHLYLFQRDSTGGWRLAATQRVLRGQPCLMPASGALQYDRPGRKELLVVLSPREEPSLATPETAELDALAASVSADILKATVSSGESAYAVDMRPQAGQQKVAFEITLEFR
jgi:hypothetical protein